MRVGATVGLGLALWAAAPAGAVTRFNTVDVSGSIEYVWRGDPARGCAAEGLCGVSGSIRGGTNEGSSFSGPGSQFPLIDFAVDDAVARTDNVFDGGMQPCINVVPFDVEFGIRRQPSGGLRAVASPDSVGGPSAGLCSGPTAADLARVTFPVRKLSLTRYEFSRADSAVGPFDVTAIPNIHVTFSHQGISSGTSSGSPAGSPPTRQQLLEQASLSYRVTSITGALDTSFSARPGFACQPLGACGTSGHVDVTMTGASGRLVFTGSRLVKHRVSDRQAVADLVSGRIRAAVEPYGLTLATALAGTDAGPGIPTCSDTEPGGPSALSLAPGGRLLLDPAGFGGFGAGDALRTRCAGPSDGDLESKPALAVGSINVRDAGRRQLTLVLRAGGSSAGSVYAVRRTGAITTRLVLAKESGSTVSERVSEGPGGT
jgi:hypothetical protein